MTTPKRKRAPGGGRPRTVNGVKIAVTLAPADVAYLATLGSNRSAVLRMVIGDHRAWHWLLALVNAGGWINPPLPVGVELDPEYAAIAKRRVEEALTKEGNNGETD